MGSEIFDVYGPENGTEHRLSHAVAAAFPGQALVEIGGSFDLEEYARHGRCEATLRAAPHPRVESSWGREHGVTSAVRSGVFDVRWDGETVVVVCASWPDAFGRPKSCSYVVARERAMAQRFVAAVCAFCNDPREAVLVFRGGCWEKDDAMGRAIGEASFEDLVLAGDMGREISGDFSSFLSARDEYARYRVPWKRGVVFVGPPGNGKTHCLRATIRLLGVPCLYVQSLKSRYETDDANIAAVFDRAREVTPCCLVFEDLDALITPENRSSFLNQLDGFANATGMLTLATTNHPEVLDPAILERPSRFDRKYHFTLPGPVERRRYIDQWRRRLDAAMAITDGDADALVAASDGFSFAYLKELFLSGMMRWIGKPTLGAMAGVLRAQLEELRVQMKTDAAPSPARPPSELGVRTA